MSFLGFFSISVKYLTILGQISTNHSATLLSSNQWVPQNDEGLTSVPVINLKSANLAGAPLKNLPAAFSSTWTSKNFSNPHLKAL